MEESEIPDWIKAEMKESAAAKVQLVQFEMKPEKKKSTGSQSLTGFSMHSFRRELWLRLGSNSRPLVLKLPTLGFLLREQALLSEQGGFLPESE